MSIEYRPSEYTACRLKRPHCRIYSYYVMRVYWRNEAFSVFLLREVTQWRPIRNFLPKPAPYLSSMGEAYRWNTYTDRLGRINLWTSVTGFLQEIRAGPRAMFVHRRITSAVINWSLLTSVHLLAEDMYTQSVGNCLSIYAHTHTSSLSSFIAHKHKEQYKCQRNINENKHNSK